MSDFNIKVTVRNGRLLRAIREKCGTGAELSRQTGVEKTVISGLITMRVSPLLADGRVKPVVDQICDFLGKNFEDLWPGKMAEMVRRKSSYEVEVSMEEAMRIAGPENETVQRMMIDSWTRGMGERDLRLLRLRLDGATLAEAAEELGITQERVRQLEIRAHRHIRVAAFRQGVKSIEDIHG